MGLAVIVIVAIGNIVSCIAGLRRVIADHQVNRAVDLKADQVGLAGIDGSIGVLDPGLAGLGIDGGAPGAVYGVQRDGAFHRVLSVDLEILAGMLVDAGAIAVLIEDLPILQRYLCLYCPSQDL